MFVDVKRSTTFLKDYEQEFMFSDQVPAANEGQAAAADGDAAMESQ